MASLKSVANTRLRQTLTRTLNPNCFCITNALFATGNQHDTANVPRFQDVSDFLRLERRQRRCNKVSPGSGETICRPRRWQFDPKIAADLRPSADGSTVCTSLVVGAIGSQQFRETGSMSTTPKTEAVIEYPSQHCLPSARMHLQVSSVLWKTAALLSPFSFFESKRVCHYTA